MNNPIARLHIRALPHTWSSQLGVAWVGLLYALVGKVGYVYTVERNGKIVGVISGIGRLILTMVVDPEWQRRGIGRELLGRLRGVQHVYTEECSVGFYLKMGFRQRCRVGGLIWLSRD